MSAAPKASRVSPKQRAADKANLFKARAAQRTSGALHHHTAKQKAASRANLVKARSAQKARRAGKQPVKPKAAAARYPQLGLGLFPAGPSEPAFSLHLLPACGPVALAEHLRMFTGIVLPDEAILDLHRRAGITTIPDLLERLMAEGFTGPETRLAYFERCDPDTAVPGLLYGVDLPGIGYHAVLLREGGMLSWGQVLPLTGRPDEAWWLEWEAE